MFIQTLTLFCCILRQEFYASGNFADMSGVKRVHDRISFLNKLCCTFQQRWSRCEQLSEPDR